MYWRLYFINPRYFPELLPILNIFMPDFSPTNPFSEILMQISSMAEFDWEHIIIAGKSLFFLLKWYSRAMRSRIVEVLPVPGGPCMRWIPSLCFPIFKIAWDWDSFFSFSIISKAGVSLTYFYFILMLSVYGFLLGVNNSRKLS